MSYDISFKAKVEGTDEYISVYDCTANTTWNLGQMIRESTGLKWENEANNGYVKDIIPFIVHGLDELSNHPELYKKFEASNGWGSICGCINFFSQIISDWSRLSMESPELANAATFWIE